MKMSNISREFSVEMIQQFTDYLNKVKCEYGEINKNNEKIWKRLNRISNEEWLAIIDTMFLLDEQYPRKFLNYNHRNDFLFAKLMIERNGECYDDVLTIQEPWLDGKRIAWDVMISMYQVWTRVWDEITKPEPQSDSTLLKKFLEKLNTNV